MARHQLALFKAFYVQPLISLSLNFRNPESGQHLLFTVFIVPVFSILIRQFKHYNSLTIIYTLLLCKKLSCLISLKYLFNVHTITQV